MINHLTENRSRSIGIGSGSQMLICGISPLLRWLILLLALSSISTIPTNKQFQQNRVKFTKDQVKVNCSEPICVGPFKDVYCQGPIIWAAWHFGLQKECPAIRMRFDAKTVLRNFDKAFEQGKLGREAFQHFCEENFDSRPYLEEAHLPDWKPEPKMLSTIRDHKMRLFAMEMHKIWPQLSRRFVEDVHQSPEHYPLLPVPNTFIIPGNLVQIYYYWDTYWIIRGLLHSELYDTAKGILRNFAHVMKSFARGHIPNSGLFQHQRRSQPPMFAQMVNEYYQYTGDKAFLEEILPSVERELSWWRKNRTVQVEMDGEKYTAYRYKTMTNCPRPESLMLDYYYAMESGREDLQFIWSSINSAVESGMDFSTRWFSMDSEDDEMAYTLKGIRTNDIVPVDLNVYMALNYRSIARLYSQELGNLRKGKFFEVLAESLASTVEAIFRDRRDSTAGVWFDYDLAQGRIRRRFFPVNIFPLLLFAEQRKGSRQCERDCHEAIQFLKASGALEYKGGIPSSMARGSIETWDFPNGEPPFVHLTVQSLLKCASVNSEAWPLAKKVADGLLTTAYNGLFHPRRGMPAQIWEKYDVRFDDGRSGFGGDYIPQTGFGSTNGALLDLIRVFYTSNASFTDQ